MSEYGGKEKRNKWMNEWMDGWIDEWMNVHVECLAQGQP